VDVAVDPQLDQVGTEEALALRGKAAVANARLAYQAYEQKFAGDRFAALKADGANSQRPLWASTGVKNPDYDDTLYVSELVVSHTVNTMPEKTLEAYADHGTLDGGDTVRPHYDDARKVMADLAAAGVDYDDVIATLEQEGVDKFVKSWDELVETVRGQMEKQ
jgi:transaldolase